MAAPPPKLNAASVLERLARVTDAHHSIHHHAAERTAANYAERAAAVKAELVKSPPK